MTENVGGGWQRKSRLRDTNGMIGSRYKAIIDKEEGMGGFIYFTEEQKQRANAVDLEDFFPDRERNCFVLEEKNGWPVITVLQ